MANQNGRPIAPARKLMAAVLGTIAVFVMLFGLGLSSWSIVALGVALLALAIALAMVSVVRRGARAWIAGTVQVKAVSQPPASSVYGRAELSVMVIAPGLPIQEVTIRDPRVPVEKWPLPGDTLPVSVDVDDMRRVRIDWDEAPSRSDSPDLDPPPPSFDIADDDIADDLLDDVEPPPWATRDRQWGLGPDEPPAPAPRSGDDLDDVVVHDTPAGPIVEGQLVSADDRPPPLPQRARSAPAQGRPAGSKPSPHPRAATAVVDPETETPGPWADNPQPRSSTPEASSEARPTPPQAAAAPPPEQRHPEESQPTGFADDQPVTATHSAPPPVPDRPTESPAPAASAARSESPAPAASAARSEAPAPAASAAGTESPAAGAEPQPVRPYVEPQAEVRPTARPVPDRPVTAAASVARPVAETHGHDPELDLALDGDPEPAPETGPAASTALASDIIAPPAGAAPVNATTAPPTTPAPSASAGSAPATADPAAGAPPGRTGSPWADLEGGFEPDERTDELITAYPSARPGPGAAIHGVGITALVTNLERSIAFYRDILGFFEIDSSTVGAVLASGDTRLVLRTVPDLAADAGRLISLNLEVGDVDAVYQDLKAKGVSFVHGPRPVNRGDKLELWAASLSDPDKHNIAITQWRAIR